VVYFFDMQSVHFRNLRAEVNAEENWLNPARGSAAVGCEVAQSSPAYMRISRAAGL